MLCVSLQIPVSCRAEGVIRRALGVPLPVTPGRGIPNGRGTNTDGFFHTLPTMTVGAHPQGNHGVHARIVLNGQMPADIFQMRIISGFRVAGPHARHWECPTLGLALLGGLRVLMINPSGQSQRLAALPALRKQQLHLGIAAIFPPMFGLAVLKARRTVGVDAAAELFVAVLPIQAFRDAVAHVPVKLRAQLGNGQQALVIARRTFQNHGGSEAVLL